MEAGSSARGATADEQLRQPHAYHQNLPMHHKCENGIPFVTKFAAKKAKAFLDLVFSIQLTEDLFNPNGDDDMDMKDETESEPAFDEDSVQGDMDSSQETLYSLSKKCLRLQSLLSTLDQLKFCGVSTSEWCECVLHLMRIITATFSVSERKVSLHFEVVGFIYTSGMKQDEESEQELDTTSDLQTALSRDFALPTPARELLLSVLIHILSNKGILRSVSNSSLYPEGQPTSDRQLLVLHWKTLFRTLLRTAPHLDEHQMMRVALDSSTRQNTVVKRTVQLIRDARHFFDQGIRPDSVTSNDKTAKAIWEMVRTDVLFHSHTHACYRGAVFLYLFTPSSCTQDFYLSVLPEWLEAWTNIDRCPEFDFLWLAMFCRARKYVAQTSYNWAPLRRRLLTHASYWLQLPIGGRGDKSFPRASNPRSRSCPPRLKVFAGASSAYDEGIDFVAKIAKLLVVSLGTGPNIETGSEKTMSEGTHDILRFLSFVAPYFNPSNIGSWTFTLGAFLHYFAYELCCRVGEQGGWDILSESYPELAKTISRVQPGSNAGPVPPHELVAILDACLPLCQQALYSKNGHVGRAAEAAVVYLVQIDPVHTTPSLLDFAAQALDFSAINSAHQAPSAISALARLVQPALRSDPVILLSRLPLLLQLTLAGIDSNDQNKTIRTLIFYRSLTSWVPIGGKPESWSRPATYDSKKQDGTTQVGRNLLNSLADRRMSTDYLESVASLSEVSLLRQHAILDSERSKELDKSIIEESSSAMSDWSLEFLDRIFELLRVSGEREKTSKSASGVASRYSSADVMQARNFSRVLKECLVQVFSSADDEGHRLLTNSVVRFLAEETLPSAAKDASLLCQAVAAARQSSEENNSSPGLDALVPVLCDDLRHHSIKTCIYRVRCLSGAVRKAGEGLLKHKAAISEALELCLSSSDRHLFKTGCKLLRHTLSTLTESYAISSNYRARIYSKDDSGIPVFGRSAELHSDPIIWHVPNDSCLDFVWSIFDKHLCQRLGTFSQRKDDSKSVLLTTTDTALLRQCLRIVRYSIRGGASVLLDEVQSEQEKDEVPYEMAAKTVILKAPEEIRQSLRSLRGRLSSFLVILASVVASESLYPNLESELKDEEYRKAFALIGSDPKVCKEATDIALLLLTRRGSAFRSQELKTIWKAQNQLTSDFGLSALSDRITESLQAANLYEAQGSYRDGEDGGKSIPRRLLVERVQLFHDSLQRNASFEVPRSLRRLDQKLKLPRSRVFQVPVGVNEFLNYLETSLDNHLPRAIDAYEGIVDGLFAMCCHPNTRVRASSVSVIDYALTRFGWLGESRIPRLLSALRLGDESQRGVFGLPSCSQLVHFCDQQGKRKKLADATKGICSIISLQRLMKFIHRSEKLRQSFAETMLQTDDLISLVPPEELQKIVLYLQTVFSPFRSRFFWLPRTSTSDEKHHTAIVKLSLSILSENVNTGDEEETTEVHWRKLLMACWFLQTVIDSEDMKSSLAADVWKTCFYLLESQSGQPLQRVALGLMGKLISLSTSLQHLEERFQHPEFCQTLVDALVYDHREDSSMNGGHNAQWSSGIEDILRDSARHISPRNLFPFQRTSQSTGSFQVSHSRMIEVVLRRISKPTANKVWSDLLALSVGLAGKPPGEDQRNQHVTSAEIYAGVCGAFIRGTLDVDGWNDGLLSHLEQVMGKIPFSLSGAYFDAIRYSLQFSSPPDFFPLTKWLAKKIEDTLWQSGSAPALSPGVESFTEQSKWLYLLSAVLIELDENLAESNFVSFLVQSPSPRTIGRRDMSESWKLISSSLLSRLLNAIGHPFDSCRDHLSRCLFRICYCHRKQIRVAASRGPSRSSSEVDLIAGSGQVDPGSLIVARLASLTNGDHVDFTDKNNSLSTARRFISYCVQLGEAKAEYSEYVIPLLPLVFAALKSTVEEDIAKNQNASEDENTAKRALETEVTKQFRYAVAEISVTSVISYGKSTDIGRVLSALETQASDSTWQIRHASANFLRCFQGAHKYLLSSQHIDHAMGLVERLLADERREVADAAMAALTGMLAVSEEGTVSTLVTKYSTVARKSIMKRKKILSGAEKDSTMLDKERLRAKKQQLSVFFLCAAIMAQPYDTPHYVPVALAAISRHSFERSAPLNVRDTVKKCCSEYKKTHMSDNWALHKRVFTESQLEALEDVVSSPHYYA